MTESLKTLRELIKKAQDNPNDETALYILRLAAGNSLAYLIDVAEAAMSIVDSNNKSETANFTPLRVALAKVQR